MSSTLRLDIGLLLLRFVFGFLMIYNHGWPKLEKYLYGDPTQFADPLGFGKEYSLLLAIFAEFVCSVLLILGLFSRWALFFLAFTMAVAVFIVHGADPLLEQELALLYLAGYIFLWLSGPGKYSLDVGWLKKTY
ncbi:MAG: DoxX family protein [Phaeodactylibacter sp.]|nr:DoxX family protein [Phaeodactylibacter sp.]